MADVPGLRFSAGAHPHPYCRVTGVALYLFSKVGSIASGGADYADVIRLQVVSAKESTEASGNSLMEAVGTLGLKELPSSDTLDNVEAQLDAATSSIGLERTSEEAGECYRQRKSSGATFGEI